MPDYEFGEPWEGRLLDGSFISIWTADGECVADWVVGDVAYVEEGGYLDDEHATRILACVNACAGIPTETIEKIGLGGVAKMFLYKAMNAPGPEQEGEPT